MLEDKAAIFVDGRYTVQAPAQVDGAVFAVRHLVNEPPGAWIEANLQPGGRLGYDPWLHTPEMVERLAEACRAAGGELVAVESNPIDAIWHDRPAPPLGADQRASRCASPAKAPRRRSPRVRDALKGGDGLLVSDAHNVAWLFNIRGADVAHTPLPLGFAYLPREGRPTLFVDGRKLSGAMRARLGAFADIDEPDALVAFMTGLGAAGAAHRLRRGDRAGAADPGAGGGGRQGGSSAPIRSR